MVWRMHQTKRMVATCRFDWQVVWLLSTSINLVGPQVFAKQWINGRRIRVPSTFQQVEYQHYMMDVIDQMRREYYIQIHSHKW